MDTFSIDPMTTDSTSTDSRDSHNLLAVALEAYACHLSVVPPRQDGSKAPIESWKDYQREPADEDKIREWYGYGNGATGIGIVCGRVSGNLECLDFDCPDTYQAFIELAEQADLGELIDHLTSKYHEVSPSGGHHLPYRCDVIEGNQKLARRLKRPEEKKHDRDNYQVLIETRGEGGYLITAPSNGPVHPSGRPYLLLSGGFATIPHITPPEREELLRLARTFDQTEPLRPVAAVPSSTPASPTRADRDGVDGRPGDEFNARMTWEALLEPLGWRRVFSRGGVTFWRRPGKTQGVSATTGYAGTDFFYPFTSSTEFDPNRAYSKFSVFAITSHSGDFQAAARALGQAGYGSQAKSRPQLKSVAPGGKSKVGPDPGSEPSPVTTPPHRPTPNLILGKKGIPVSNLANAEELIRLSPEFEDAVGFDAFSDRVMATKPLPWDPELKTPREWTDNDDTSMTIWLQREAGLSTIGSAVVAQAVRKVAQNHRFHPVRDWLDRLVWDNVPRLDRLLTDYFRSEVLSERNTKYRSHVGAKFAIGAVSRILDPGRKNDCMPVLQGKQGIGKSTGVRFLFGDEWFTDHLPDLRNKDAMIQLVGKWAIEIAELGATYGVEVGRVKAFLSTINDRYRPTYGRSSEDHPRQCVFIGTVNDDAYLKDPSGGRRFWPVTVEVVDLVALQRDREPLWAEAVARYRQGEHWWLEDPDVLEEAAQLQDAVYHHDERESLILRYIHKEQVPAEDANGDPILDRYGQPILAWVDRKEPLQHISVKEVMLDVLGYALKDLKKGEQESIGKCLSGLGFTRVRKGGRNDRKWCYRCSVV